MLRRCSWLPAVQARRFSGCPRTLACAPRSLLDVLIEKTPPLHNEERPLSEKPKLEQDFMIAAIRKAGTRDQLLEVVYNHGIMMSKSHLMLCWKRFAFLVKQGENVDGLRARRGFQQLTDVTCDRIYLFPADQILSICDMASAFEFDADSKLVDYLCAVLRTRLKDLTFVELISLQSFLKKIPGTSSRKEIMTLAIPVVFQSRVQKDLDPTSSSLCYRALLFVLTESVDQETCDLVGERALNFCKEFSLVQVFAILSSSTLRDLSVQYSQPIRQILITCMDIIAANKSVLDQTDIEMILRCCYTQKVGSKALFEVFWSLAPSWPFDATVSLLKTSFKVNYLSLPAAELAVNLVLHNKDQHTEDIDVLRLAEAVALAFLHYDKDSEEAMRASEAGRILARAQLKIDEIVEARPYLLPQIMLCLGVVGVFPKERLDVLFDNEFQRSLSQHETSYKFLLELEQCMRTFFGESTPYKVIPELKALADRDATQCFIPRSLTETLEIAFGGEQFVAKDVTTPLGAKADYLVAMRKGEYAIAVSDSLCYPFEKLPAQSKVVAILLEKEQQDTFAHTGLRKLLFSLRERHLRAQRICTLVINLEKFETLPIYEKTPFVMKGLKEVLRDGPVYNQSDDANVTFPAKW